MKIEIQVPVIGESITEAVIGEWLINEGEYVEQDAAVCMIESEKASMEVPAPESGTLSINAQTGDTVLIGSVIAAIDTDAQPQPKSSPAPVQDAENKTNQKKPTSSFDKKLSISHVAQKIIENHHLDVHSITGSGPGGRIVKADTKRILEKQHHEEPEPFTRNIRKERMSTLRQTISNHLLAAKNNTAMLTTINEVDMSNIIALRKKYKESFQKKYSVKLGFMSFFTTAICTSLKEFPVVNAKMEDNHIVYHDFADISIAVSSPRGLVVPVIRNAESKSPAQLEEEIAIYGQKAKEGRLTIDEMSGGTFTITNGGVFGSLISTPIINTPQSAVLGMHTIQERPMAVNGKVIIRPMMYISLSYDHRIIDGKESVSFIVRVKELLENPDKTLLGM